MNVACEHDFGIADCRCVLLQTEEDTMISREVDLSVIVLYLYSFVYELYRALLIGGP